MKETARTSVELGGFKQLSVGWHQVEIVEPVENLKSKDGADYQDKDGNKILKFPCVCIEDGEDKDLKVDRLVNLGQKNAAQQIADLLGVTGLWEGLCKAYPGDDVSVLDKEIMDKVKAKITHKPFWVKIELDKKENSVIRAMVHNSEIKRVREEEAAKGVGAKQETPKQEPAKGPETANLQGW